MALLEISDLPPITAIDDSAWLHIKTGGVDYRSRPQVLFDLYNSQSAGNETNRTVTKDEVGLSDVSNDAQLTIANNLTDLTDFSAARTTLSVDSSAEVDVKIAVHVNRTDNPHSVTKAQVSLGNVPNYTASSTISDTSTTKFATINAVSQVNTKVNALVNNIIPVGAIMMWGSTSPVPTGWVIMDGQNGTIDMRGKFVRGGDALGGLTQVGTEGGQDSNIHTHVSEAAGTALTEAQGPRHRHALGHKITGSHLYGGSGGQGGGKAQYEDADPTAKSDYSGNDETHTHDITVNNSVADAQSNLPPYYTLIYIQKT